MYIRDQRKIEEYGQSCPQAMFECTTFVLLTIQQSIMDMQTQCKDVRINGQDSRFLWGFKDTAYEWHQDHKDGVYHALMNTYHGYADTTVSEHQLLMEAAALPGLGLVKGGFLCQLLFGLGGCIDSHNQKIFEVPTSRFKASRFKSANMKTRSRLASEYSKTCYDVGGPEFLWDNWCNHVGKQNNMSGDSVSAMHVTAIKELQNAA